MTKRLAFVYGLVSYLIFFVVFLYAIGFVGNLIVPKSIDSGATGPVWKALLIDALLLGLFAIQHSVMARPAFKRVWTKIVPRSVERSTYVLLASLILGLLFWQWRPISGTLWNIESSWGSWLLWALFFLGWSIVLISTFFISHTHLFGLKQVYENLRSKKLSEPEFQMTGFYRYIRHPLMFGFLIAFWATPTMTVGHLFFTFMVTGYILVALQLEEHDLVQHFGRQYLEYRQHVPMLIPSIKHSESRQPVPGYEGREEQ